jgi:transglutaminase-like putative cysteine protease
VKVGRLLRPLPRGAARAGSLLVLVAWIATMAVVFTRTFAQARSMNLATDLARYGTAAEWRGVYYRGEKVGFTVSQTSPAGDGFEVHEDARLRMSLLGATTAAAIRTTAQLDAAFGLRSFQFSLDPGTGPVEVSGTVTGKRVSLTLRTASGTQREDRDLADVPVLSLSLPRRLAAAGFEPGAHHQVLIFDPATMRSEPVTIAIGRREIVNLTSPLPARVGPGDTYRVRRQSMPAFRVDMTFAGLKTTAWITDTGEVLREESQLGLMSVRETPEVAQRMAISRGITGDLLEASAVVPRNTTKQRIDDGRDVRRIRLQVEGADLSGPDLQGAGQSVAGNVLEIRDARSIRPSAAEPGLERYLRAEPLIESDDPGIRAEAEAAVAGTKGPRAVAERLTRAVNAMLDKKPTVSLPSAREVLRTKVGDCNEHTALYVAMARSIGLPSRIAVGLAYTRGAFFYHAWPEVYLDEGGGRGLWLPVDPTFNQFPADATHIRLARGGLDRQAAILPMIGRITMTIVDVELAPGSTPVLVGREPAPGAGLPLPVPVRAGLTCWSSPASAR